MSKLTQNEIQFLLGLRELTLKWGVTIAGCGCCGSPFLCEQEIVDTLEQGGYCSGSGDDENIFFVRPPSEKETNDLFLKRNWEEYGEKIIHPSKFNELAQQ